jgi:GxxExxY protein
MATPHQNARLTETIIGFAINVHRHLGSGLLESAYEECLCLELAQDGIPFRRQVTLPIVFKTIRLDCGYRLDIVVGDLVIVELKTFERLVPIHEAQPLTYLKLSGMQHRAAAQLQFDSPQGRFAAAYVVGHIRFSVSDRLTDRSRRIARSDRPGNV